MYKRILLAADGSANSIRAAREAAVLASLVQDASVEVLFVVEPEKVKEEVLHSKSHEEVENKRKQKLLPVIEEFLSKQVDHSVTIVIGDPGPAIVEYSIKHHIDAVVIGSRGLNAFQEFVLGSVSHKVVKRAQCPVIVIK